MIKNKKNIDNTKDFFGLNIVSNNKEVLLNEVKKDILLTKEPLKVFTPNPEQIVEAYHNKEFLHNLQQADYLLPDGSGIVLASKLLNLCNKDYVIQERITGVDFTQDLLKFSLEKNLKVLVIGGRYKDIKSINPIITVNKDEQGLFNFKFELNNCEGKEFIRVNWLEGYNNIENIKQDEEEALFNSLKKIKPDLVFVAFGAPFQEKWIVDHFDLLSQSRVRLAMAVGGTFDYIFSKTKRAPIWIQKIGLEWLFRLLQQPWRIKRQVKLFKYIQLIMMKFFSCLLHLD